MSTTPPTAGNVKLWLCFCNATKLALSIPLDQCNRFAVNPLRWLRFLGFTIYGREGRLSRSKAGPEIDDYTAYIEARSYYFVSDGEARLADVDVMDDRTSNVSSLTSRPHDFRTNVIGRDGTCVITPDLVSNCAACHIIPHAKGSHYISNAVRHRGGADDSVDINDINDTRNGILLSNLFCQPFGSSNLAFLKTPTFALTVDDIPYEPQKDEDQQSPASRLTLHHFADLGPLISLNARHNSDARQPQDTSEWPPAIIVNLSYAAAAMKAWSPKSFVKYVREKSRDAYYRDEDNDNVLDRSGPSHAHAQISNQTTGQSGRYALRIRNKTSNIPPKEMDMMDCVTALWMLSSRGSEPKLEDDHASTLARNESVKLWLQSIEDPDTQK